MFDVTTIWNYLKKNFTLRDVLFFALLILLFFGTRLINLDKWPIFSDEGIYIRWAKVAWKDATWRFISLTDGRQPLQTWGTIPFLKLFSDNALLAGRLFSVSTGFVGLIGMFVLNFYLWGKRGAFIATLFYICIPYFVFYDRIALVDSAVNAGFIWMLFFSILLARTRRLDVALLFGFTAGFALLTKSSSRMFIALAALAPILFLTKNKKIFILNSLSFYFLWAIVLFMGILFYNIQRLSPFLHYVELKNATFVMPLSEFITRPFEFFWHNLKIIPLYTTWEAGWVIVLFSMLGMYQLFKKERRMFFYLLAYFILPFGAIAFFGKVVFPRYLIFYGSLFIITATYFFTTLKQKTANTLIGITLVSMLFLDYPLLFNPVKASFPEIDRGQYVVGVTSVWGAQDLMNLMRERSQVKPVVILAEGNFGLVADVLDVFMKDGDKIEIKGLWPLDEIHLYENQPLLAEKEVYVVYSHRTEFPDHWPIELVKEYKKPEGGKSLYLFKLKTEPTNTNLSP